VLFSTKSIYVHITFHSLKTAQLAEKIIVLGLFMGAITDRLASVLIANTASILLYVGNGRISGKILIDGFVHFYGSSKPRDLVSPNVYEFRTKHVYSANSSSIFTFELGVFALAHYVQQLKSINELATFFRNKSHF
jgi:hypothetical protein